ncbi:thiol reductant ABC exporter subunit CydD [Desulfobulbus alkaliphilus]|uniref:thiol reductant ABC exporter subunit CydD n=1 Tax=Desulfobulbus alkaliphilus TaxID=869814 RepID=UPI001965F158|nr:thiol reductant ABC exporter subunit CydD [Desulfobulbus alkaliphilus]MBM9535848.1 thiol reductant ABC exporter subunit CydD [Desulfobulbus alkaliphilus]
MPPSTSLTWLQSLHHRCRPWISLTVVLGSVSGACIIIQAGLLAHIIHAACIDAAPREALHPFFLMLLVVLGVRALLTWVREICGQKASTLVRRTVRRKLLKHVQALGPMYIRDTQTAPLTSTLVERVEGLHGYFAQYLPQKPLALIVPLMIGLTALAISWVVGLIFLITAPLVPLFMIMIGRGAEKLNQKNFQLLSRMSAHFLDTLQGLTTLKLFQRSTKETERLATSSERYRRGTMTVLRVAFLSSAILEFLTCVALAMTAVFLGLSYLHYFDFGLYSRPLTLQTGLFLLLLAPELFLPLRELGNHYHARAEALGAAAEISSILHQPLPPSEQDKGRSLLVNDGISLDLRHVSHSFSHGQRPALNDLNLHIKAGEWLAIVGASGAGKTTLMHLLLRFLPLQQGSIEVNGQPLTSLNTADWLRHLAWVPQQPTLFHGTVADNITMGDPHLTQEQIITAARAAQVDDFAQDLTSGLATAVGEQGKLLSGGQARRVALARAFARKSSLVILDEPTASLDGENERLITAALQELARGRTMIMLTHRLETARAADRIAVMANGSVVEVGSHQDLLAAQGIYAGLFFSSGEAAS